MKHLTILSIVCGVALAIAWVDLAPTVFAQMEPQPQPKTPEQVSMEEVVKTFDLAPNDALVGLLEGASIIQKELDAKGSEMDAKQVLLNSMNSIYKIKVLQSLKQTALDTKVSTESDVDVLEYDRKIQALMPEIAKAPVTAEPVTESTTPTK